MGILDNVTNAFSRGTASAERTARAIKLKAQLSDVQKRRQGLVAQLGAALYETTRNDIELRTPFEALYCNIESCDTERIELQHLIVALETEVPRALICSVCGAQASTTDLYCLGCGASIVQAIPSQAGSSPKSVCKNCGEVVMESDLFCMGCGSKAVGDIQDGTEFITDQGDESQTDLPNEHPCEEETR